LQGCFHENKKSKKILAAIKALRGASLKNNPPELARLAGATELTPIRT
jgi:hypothetical protein